MPPVLPRFFWAPPVLPRGSAPLPPPDSPGSPHTLRQPRKLVSRECVAAKQKRENEKQGQEAKKHPCRLASQEKGPRKGLASSSPVSSRRIPKRRGAQNGTPRKTPNIGMQPKRAINQARRDKKREQEQQTQVRVGVSCCYLIFVSQKKKQTKIQTTSAKNLRKRERTPNSRPDIKKHFPNTFGSEPPKHKAQT